MKTFTFEIEKLSGLTFERLLVRAKITAIEHFFKVTKDNLMRDHLNLIVARKTKLCERNITIGDIDLIQNRHQQIGIVDQQCINLINQLLMKFMVGIINMTREMDFHPKHSKIFHDLGNGIQNDVLAIEKHIDIG